MSIRGFRWVGIKVRFSVKPLYLNRD